MVRDQLQKNMDRMNELWTCRTPNDFAAVQNDMVRENRFGEQPREHFDGTHASQHSNPFTLRTPLV
jgi:hypothetical protein